MILAGLLTYGLRISFILLIGNRKIPIIFKRTLSLIPPAVLSAIIASELLIKNETLNISINNYRMMAGIIAILVAWRTKNTILTVFAGMASLWILQGLF